MAAPFDNLSFRFSPTPILSCDLNPSGVYWTLPQLLGTDNSDESVNLSPRLFLLLLRESLSAFTGFLTHFRRLLRMIQQV